MRRYSLRHISLCALVFAFFAFTQNSSNAQNWFLPIDISSSSEPAVNASFAPLGYYLAADQACVQSVVDVDDFCVTTDWDQLCQDDYLACLGCTELTWYLPAIVGDGPAVYSCTEPAGYYTPVNQACVASTAAADDYCTVTDWDNLCNDAFESCAFGCDAEWHIPIIASNGPAMLACSPPLGYYTPDQTCVAQVISEDSYCVNTSWDNLCQSAYETCAFGCDAQWRLPYSTDASALPVYGCTAPFEYYTPDQACIEQVLTDDSFCIQTGWDDLCQDAYELCFYGCDAQYYIPLDVLSGPAVLACPGSEPFGYWSPDAFCIQDVINNDSYCVTTFWDDLCQSTFEFCFYGCNAQWYLPITVPSGDPAVLGCSAPAGYELAVGQDCVETIVANDPFCLENGWDLLCNNNYEDCYLGCTYSFACNYAPTHIVEDGSCTEAGCTDSGALNYNPFVNCDNGSCIYNNCPEDLNNNGSVGTDDLLQFLGAFGNVCL